MRNAVHKLNKPMFRWQKATWNVSHWFLYSILINTLVLSIFLLKLIILMIFRIYQFIFKYQNICPTHHPSPLFSFFLYKKNKWIFIDIRSFNTLAYTVIIKSLELHLNAFIRWKFEIWPISYVENMRRSTNKKQINMCLSRFS